MSIADRIRKQFGLVKREDYQRVLTNATRMYEAGRLNRMTQDWMTTYATIDSDIRTNIVAVRERARNMTKNDGIARRFLNLCIANVVGPNGFKLQMNVTERDKNYKLLPDVIANTRIEEAWQEFIKRENCSLNGRHSFRSLCDQIISYRKIDGEAFLRIVYTKSMPHGIGIEIIPTELIDEQYNEQLANGAAVKMGVELNKYRKPVAYYIKETDQASEVTSPGVGYANTRRRIPASEVIHYFKQQWADQTRGMSDLAPSMVRLRHLSGYEEAAVQNARITAAKMGFFSNKAGNPATEFVGDSVDASGNIQLDVEPGKMNDIGDKEFTPWDPTFPHAQHEMFVKTEGKMIAAGFNVSYASLSADLSEANYSSNRVGLLDEREMWKIEQMDFIEQVLQPIFAAWLDSVLLMGILGLPNAKFDKFNKPVFVGRRWPWIDPAKDLEATRNELQLRIKSLYDVAGENGNDLEQIFADTAEVEALAKKHNITLNFESKQLPTPQKEDETKPKEKPEPEEDDEELTDATKALVLEALGVIPSNGNGKH